MKKPNSKFFILALILLAFVSSKLFALVDVEIMTTANFKSNIRADKTIYLGLQTDISYIDKEKRDLLIKKYLFYFEDTLSQPKEEGLFLNDLSDLSEKELFEFIKNNFKFHTSLYLGKVVIENDLVQFIPVNLKKENFDEVGDFYLRNENQELKLNKEKAYQYFLNLYKENCDFLKSYFDEINKNNGIKLYYVDEYLNGKFLSKEEIKSKLLALSESDDYYEIVNFKDERFYTYLVWSLRDFLIPYPIGKYQDENELLFNLASYKKYKNEGVYIKTDDEPIDVFFFNIHPTKYAVGYLQKEVNVVGGAIPHSWGTKHISYYDTATKFFFHLQEDTSQFAQYFKPKIFAFKQE